MLKQAGSAQRCFIYHNMELALEWLETQRAAMYDPTLADLFLRYKNGTIYNEAISQGDQYFWNFTNPAAGEYFIKSILKAIDDPYVDGTFTDDVDGLPTEHPNAPKNLQMTVAEVQELRYNTQKTGQQLIDTFVAKGKFNWQAFGGQDGAGSSPTPSSCTAWMRARCHSEFQNHPFMMTFDSSPQNVNQILAAFLIVRPPIGYLGYGWESDDRQWNSIFLKDYGFPAGLCEEVSTGVFSRQWNKVVTLDCNNWKAQI